MIKNKSFSEISRKCVRDNRNNIDNHNSDGAIRDAEEFCRRQGWPWHDRIDKFSWRLRDASDISDGEAKLARNRVIATLKQLRGFCTCRRANGNNPDPNPVCSVAEQQPTIPEQSSQDIRKLVKDLQLGDAGVLVPLSSLLTLLTVAANAGVDVTA